MTTPREAQSGAPASASRRRLLQVGLGGAALLGLGGLGFWLWRPHSARVAPSDLKALDAGAWQILAAVAACICPEGKGFPSADTIGVASRVDALLAGLHPTTVSEIRQLLGLLENPASGLLLDGRIGSFSGADSETQAKILAGWRDSDIAVKRAGFKALSGLCASVYYSHPDVYAHVGYPGPPDYGNVRRKEAGAAPAAPAGPTAVPAEGAR